MKKFIEIQVFVVVIATLLILFSEVLSLYFYRHDVIQNMAFFNWAALAVAYYLLILNLIRLIWFVDENSVEWKSEFPQYKDYSYGPKKKWLIVYNLAVLGLFTYYTVRHVVPDLIQK